MTAKEALALIVKDRDQPSLNWAVNYALAGLEMDEESEMFRVQCMYVVNNISRWRATKTNKVSSDEIKEARRVLKAVYDKTG